MSPPASGNYYIRNKASKYFLTSKGADADASSTPVYTTKPEGELGNAYSFNLRKGEGDLYVISANLSGANVGSPANIQDGSALIWTVGEQQFRIMDAGPGVYNLRLVTENRFWYDDVAKNQPKRTVLLKTGRTEDSANWIFQAA
ncbi:hypothetical protein B0H11DRAFT_2296937 [Mycena galericulata]|nr:hypothetical protein B0H11DRAFT_2296937 [Mycena galericulata]